MNRFSALSGKSGWKPCPALHNENCACSWCPRKQVGQKKQPCARAARCDRHSKERKTNNDFTERIFLNLAVKGSALTAAAALMPRNASIASNAIKSGTTDAPQDITNSSSQGHYRPPFKFGMGGVPLGNEFSVVTDEDANVILEAAWSAGVRYYDVSPWYGLGLTERRFGYFLHNKKRTDYALAPSLLKAVRVFLGRCAIVRVLRAALAAFLIFRFAAARHITLNRPRRISSERRESRQHFSGDAFACGLLSSQRRSATAQSVASPRA